MPYPLGTLTHMTSSMKTSKVTASQRAAAMLHEITTGGTFRITSGQAKTIKKAASTRGAKKK